MSAKEIPSGNLGSISKEQEVCLRQMWAAILVLGGKGNTALLNGSDFPTVDMSEPTKVVKEIGAEEFHSAFWASPVSQHPDILVLRFLRARKWDVTQGKVRSTVL
jgi:CRAL/TRIO, N-terminal domain